MNSGLQGKQWERYRRHLSLPQVGEEGQLRLLNSRVLIVGMGGLGCPAAQYLAAAGVGTLGMVDDDLVEISNLQRQILYREEDLGRAKVEVARERLQGLNADLEVVMHPHRLFSDNALEIFRDYDLVIDGSDNFPTRYLVNDACVLLEKPNVHGSIFRFEGQASVFGPGGPCYRCLYPEPPPPGLVPSCVEGGVLGVLPGLIALIQATETIKILLGLGDSIQGRLLQYDALTLSLSEFLLRRDPGCPVCGESPTITELIDYEAFCGDSDQVEVEEISVQEVNTRSSEEGSLFLLDVREETERETAQIESAHWIPLGGLPDRLEEIADWKERVVVVHCHHGGRSRQACRILMKNGFLQVYNMTGGIDRWSIEIDPSVKRY